MTGRVGTVLDTLRELRPPRVLVRLDPFLAIRWQEEEPSTIEGLEVIYDLEDVTDET